MSAGPSPVAPGTLRLVGRRRLGVVLLVPDPVRPEIDGLQHALGSSSLGLIPPHLTLVPPVNVRADDLDAGLAALRAVGDRAVPFELRLGPPTSFHPVTPTVYLAVGGDVDAVHRSATMCLRGRSSASFSMRSCRT